MIHKTTRSILSVLLAALLLVTSIPLTPAFAGDGGGVSLQSESGEGRALKPADDGTYLIYTAENLKEFADIVNGTHAEVERNNRANAKLMENIDLEGSETNPWTPIGTSIGNPYEGTFNGDGHTISGLYIDSSSANYQGLFGYLGTSGINTGTVQNLSVSGSVSGSDHVGGVVGANGGNVINCTNTGSVKGSDHVGGVVGENSGSVINSYNTGTVTGTVDSVGGVVGYNDIGGSVTNCYNTGSVTSSGSNVGGVVGYNVGPVKNCYNTGQVKGSGNYVGGVVGQNIIISSTVTGCYFLQTDDVNSNLQGIGSDIGSGNAAAVNDLSELCKNFKSDPWTINDTLGRPVLKDNHEDDGSEQHPYRISTATQLETFRDLVNGKDDQTADPDAHAKLMNDIDLSGICSEESDTSWTPIGNIIDEEDLDSFAYTGTFDGNGNTISGLYIDDSTANYQGLFGYVGTGGKVQNLSVSGKVSGNNYVGGIAGQNRGSVEDCDFTGSVSGNSPVGGVVGLNSGYSTVENCYNIGEVSGNISGGVVGWNSGSVTNCYNIGNVSGNIYVGGVVGYNGDSVTNCYFLQGTAESGIGKNEGSGDAAEKDNTAFHSGEVAWRLQNGQTAGSSQVWGQNIKDGENDNYPQLRAFDADTPQVYKVAFMNDSEEHDAKYANSGMTVTIPAAPSREGHTFTGWSDGTSTYQAGAKVEITSDTKFTAQWTKDTVNYTVTVTTSPAEGGTVNGGGTFAEGTQVTVTATANDGYTFVAWQEGGTKIENAGASYTFTVNDNCTLTAIFEKEPEPTPDPTPTPTPDPTPSGPSTGDSTGWDDIRDELENAENGDEITIDMGDETKVPAEIFESLAGKDVEISFDLGDIQWSVNGADIPTDTDFTDLDLGVNLDTSGIPVNVINTITGEVGTVQMTLAHDGEFGFTMTLTAPLGVENAGYWANLYHYDEDADQLTFETAAEIDADGSVTLPMSHASQYAIVIDTHSHATVDVSDLFIDVAPNAWYKDAVQYAYDNGLMTGVSATEFAPEQTTTRAMIVSILARLENVTTAEAAGFADVDDEWYATAVNWAANVGVVNGYEDNTFQPNTAITREQLAAILMNYAAYKGEDVSNRADLTSYTDQPSTWAEEAMQWAVAEGLISGVTNDQLQPQSSATRAQVAAILQRLLEA